MKLIAGHINTYIEGSWPKHIIEPVTSYFVESAYFSPQYRKGHWDGRVRYVRTNRSTKQQYFPTGFLTRVCAALDEKEWPYQLEDTREYESVTPVLEFHNCSLTTGKWDFQAPVVETALAHGCGILRLPTGAGKTNVGGAILASINKPAVWLTHRLNLLHQTKERLEEILQRPIGMLGEGVRDIKLDGITVAMVQSAKPYDFTHAEVVIGDEIHHLESETWYTLFESIPARWRFGLSATPHFEGSGLSLLAMTGDVIATISIKELIDRGVLVQPNIWFVEVEDSSLAAKLPKKAPYQTVFSQGITGNSFRNSMVARVAHVFKEEQKPTLILVKRINHGEMLTELCANAGLRVQFCQGSTDKEPRRVALDNLSRGVLDCIVATVEIFGEGVDLPGIKAIINACGSSGGGDASQGSSGRQTIQVLGRGLRAAPGKVSMDYVDFADKTHRFLKHASIARVQTLEHEGYTDNIRSWSEYCKTSV